jgi:protein-S-isoprenylcysteine O-methyltransferase Ste14
MPVVLLWSIYALIAFGFRTLLQLRTTGRTGWVPLRHANRPVERLAAFLFATALVGGFAGTVLAASGLDQSLLRPWPVPPLVLALGFALYTVGTVLTFAAQLAMGRSWRIGVDATECTDLVAHGLFRLVRNPIYSAMLASVAGLTLMCCTFVTCAAFAALVLGLELQVRAVEEPHLARTHGDAYLQYASRVGRFVPWLGRSRARLVGA